MVVSISDVGIEESPVYIHKIDRRSFWESTEDTDERTSNAVKLIFKDPEFIYSFWRVTSNLDLCCVAASLNAGRGSLEEEINFIWLTDLDLGAFDLTLKQADEGKCLYARKLHYDLPIPPEKAHSLCKKLMQSGRSACRYKKSHMRVIVPYLQHKGCKAYEVELKSCNCELPISS